MKPLIYVDTSAYLCVLLGEPLAVKIAAILRDARLCSSTLLIVEAERTLIRMARVNGLSGNDYAVLARRLDDDKMLFAWKDLTLAIASDPGFPAVKLPRSLDLVHLRTALWFNEYETETHFLTLDKAQAQAAVELDLRVMELDDQ